MSKLIDLTGEKFGRLTVLERTDDLIQPSGQHKTQWLCKCDCGNEITVTSSNLKGSTKSCGCYRAEIGYKAGKNCLSHGKSNTRIYHTWEAMKQRCYNPKSQYYKRYGGRGITICDKWLHDFQAFYDWAMSHGYADNLTIDRIDNNKGYSPDNCRWATNIQQHNNQSNNKNLTYNGKTQTLAQWAKEKNIKPTTLAMRLNRGWSIEKALTKNAI